MRIPIVWSSLTEDELINVIAEAAAEELKRWKEKTSDGCRVANGGAKQGHNPVAEHLVDSNLEAVDGVHHERDGGVQKLRRRLGVEPLDQPGEVLDVSEEDGDLLALTFVPMDRLSTEQLRKLRDDLQGQGRNRAKAGKPLPLYPHATTQDVITMVGEVEEQLFILRTLLGQWLSNMGRLGAEKLSQQDRRRRLAPQRPVGPEITQR